MIKRADTSKKPKIDDWQFVDNSLKITPTDLLSMNSGVVLDNISEHIIHLDLENKIIWANRAAAESLGKYPQKIVGKYCYKLWNKGQSPCIDCPTVLAKKTGQEQIGELSSQDGRIWLVKGYPVKNEEGKVTSVIEVAREITEDKKANCQEAQNLQDKAFISEMALHLAKASDIETIYKLIGQGLMKLVGESIYIITSYDSTDSSLVVREIVGKPKNLKLIWKIFSKNIIGSKFKDIPARTFKLFRQSRLMLLKGGLAEASFGKVSKRSIKTLLSKIDLKEIYTMGLTYGQNVLGSLVICPLNGKPLLNKDLIENFINRAAMALQRVKVESERKYSQDYFKALIDHTTEIITILDSEGGIKFKNPTVKQALGYDPEEMMGKSIFDFVHPEDVPGLILKFNQEIYHEEIVSKFEIRLKHKNGDWRALETTGINLLKNPIVNGIVLSSRDITERKRMEFALRESEEKHRLLLDTIHSPILALDRELTVLYCNVSYFKALGRETENLLGKKLLDVFPSFEKTNSFRAYLECLKTEKFQEVEGKFNEHYYRVGIYPTPWGLLAVADDITENRAAHEQLVESQRKLETLMTNLPGMVYRYRKDKDWVIEFTNLGCRELTGYEPSEILESKDLSFTQIIHQNDREMVWDNILACLRDKKPYQLIYRITTKGGQIKWVWEHGQGIFDEKGKAQALEGFITDISDRKRAEEALQLSEYQYRTTIDSLADSIHVVNEDLTIILTNRVFEEWNAKLGLITAAVGKNIFDIFSYLPEERVTKEYQDVFKNGQVLITEDHNYVNNNRIITETRKIPVFEEGKVVRVVTVVRDITESKLAEERLRESELNYRQIFDGVAEGIYRSGSDGRVLLVNPALAKMLGFEEPEEMVEFNTNQDGYIDPNTHRMFLSKMARDGSVKNMVSEWRKKDGSILVARENAHAIKDEAGNIMFYEGTVEDITEKKRAEDALRTSEYQYRTTIDSMGDAVHVLDRDLQIILSNRVFNDWCKSLQLSDQVLNKNIFEICPFLSEKVRQEYNNIFKYGRMLITEESNFVAGKSVVTETRKIPVFEDDKVIRVITVMRDITEQKKSEQKLIESEEKYRQIFEGIAEGIYRSTRDGKLLYANPSLIKMLGYETVDDIQSINLDSKIYLDHKAREKFIQQIESDGFVQGFEAELLSKDGSIITVSENARLVRDGQGSPLYYEGTLEDITQRKEIEKALLDEKNKLGHLFHVGLAVAKSPTLQGKLDLTINGIKDCHLFDKAVIVLEDKNGYRSHIAHYGLNRREIENIEKASATNDEDKAKVFTDKYKISNSYLFPHDDIKVHQYFAARLVDDKYQPTGSWHPEDVLIVPLAIKGRNVGYLSVDEPIDGNRPGIETIHLLELFANQAAIAVENIRLYNDLERSYYDTLKAFVAAMDAKDPYTKGHSENVRHYALKIAKHIGLAEEKLKLIDYSSLLHDIGKLGVREYILSKPDVLSNAEYQEVKLHPVIGSRLVSEIEVLSQIVDIIYSHHEYYDGTGYPRGISGELIPLESRIIAVADAFEAMTSDRPYRKAFSFQVALQRLQDAAGTQFDKEIVRAFTELFRQESELERSGEYV